MRIGIDIVKIDRFKNKDISKFFTVNEMDYIQNKGVKKLETIAGLFAAKEAFVKALKSGLGNGSVFKQIEILHDKAQAPYILNNEFVQKKLQELGLKELEISISHTDNIAEAVCIIV